MKKIYGFLAFFVNLAWVPVGFIGRLAFLIDKRLTASLAQAMEMNGLTETANEIRKSFNSILKTLHIPEG